MTNLTDAPCIHGATLAPSEGLRQRGCGDSTALGGERMIGRAEEDGLSCADPLPVADIPVRRRPADATGERLNIGANNVAAYALGE